MIVNIKEIESENIDLAMKKSDKIIIDFLLSGVHLAEWLL